MENWSEDRLLAECHKWLHNTYADSENCCWHVANERKTTPRQGAILKAKGVLAGTPDYVINHNGLTYYIEFKKGDAKLKEAQNNVINALNRQKIKT